MVERRGWWDRMTIMVLIVGVIVVAFPVYVAFIASTHTAEQVEAAPMSLAPGDRFVSNYETALFHGSKIASQAPVARMMWVSLVTAVGIAVGKIAISLISAFAIV